jgi:N-acetylated-alpha-linked acidic dipeptidase
MLKKSSLNLIPVILLATAPGEATATSAPTIPGFRAQRADWELQFEAQLKAIPNPARAAALVTDLSNHPIVVASQWDKWNIRYVTKYLEGLGIAAKVHTYYPYIPVPRQIQVDMVEPTRRSLALKENAWPWQEHFDDVVGGFNAYTPAGEVTADLVYVNYGLATDYDDLAKVGVDVRGKIVIARYGQVFRGNKNKVAYDHGAVGLLLFDDPSEDGFIHGSVYPNGPWRTPDGIQRGTIEYIFNYPGDPLTPGWAATEHAHRIEPSQAENLPKGVPTTPLGYGEAASLLESLDGIVAPDSWQGGLSDPRWANFGGTPFTYHIGGTGKTKVHMKVDVEFAPRPIEDIVVRIPGSKHPDEVIVIGAHHDGWTYGTSDNTVNFVAVLETARALKTLEDQGWRPDRTILLAGWDGEEYGMLGSTEWGEEFQHELGKKIVGYINLDAGGGSSYFYAAGVPALDDLIYDVSKQVTVVGSNKSVYDNWVDQFNGQTPSVDREGGGTDFPVFLNYLGVPVLDLGFYSDGGNYHSTQDDLYFAQNYGDPGLVHLIATSQLAGIAALRLANADVLPMVYSAYAEEVEGYLARLETNYPESPICLARLKDSAAEWKRAAVDLEAQIDAMLACSGPAHSRTEEDLRRLNHNLMQEERALIQPKGLPYRPWFKHMIYAADRNTGYAAEFLPALEDTFAIGDWREARKYVEMVNDSLAAAANALHVPMSGSLPCDGGPTRPPLPRPRAPNRWATPMSRPHLP